MDEQEKQESLVQLYALRAELSAISMQKDESDKVLAEYGRYIETINFSKESEDAKIRRKQYKLDTLYKNLAENKRKKEEYEQVKQKRTELIDGAKKRISNERIKVVLLLLPFVITAAVFAVSVYIYEQSGVRWSLIVSIVLGISLGLYIVIKAFGYAIVASMGLNRDSKFALYARFMRISDGKEQIKSFKKLKMEYIMQYSYDPEKDPLDISKKEYGLSESEKKFLMDICFTYSLEKEGKFAEKSDDEIIQELNMQIEKIQSQIATYGDKIKRLSPKIDASKEKLDQVVAAVTEVAETQLGIFKATGKAIYKHARNTYKLLDERDWKYLDMFIYMYETGRADSKKEALQLIDQYEQNKRIEEAVYSAGQEVKQTIQRGLSSLRSSMEGCFRGLSMQLSAMHSEAMLKMDRIVGRMDDIAEGVGQISGKLDSFTADIGAISAGLENVRREINFNSALKSKASTSSQQLMSDVHYIRTMQEHAEIRRRNGM